MTTTTQISLLDRTLDLVRYPPQMQHVSWQAWDAADEYLIDYVESELSDYRDKTLAILNDDFGALGCWFAGTRCYWQNDSHVAKRSLLLNAQTNQLDLTHTTLLDSLTMPDAPLDIVLIKIPKTLALLEHQLCELQHRVTPHTRIIAAAKAKAIQSSTLKLFERYLGATHTSLARKKARLVFCEPQAHTLLENPYPTTWQTDNPVLNMVNHANVFARQQLDIGARLLLQHLPDCSAKQVLDLGCGNGILGLSVLYRYPDARVLFVDESHMAIASARASVQATLPDALSRCEFLQSNCLDEFDSLNNPVRPDVVLCNPPFHQQNAITDHIAWQMFKDARYRLNIGGELRIIGNRHLDYPQKLKRLFGGYQVIASDRKFSVLSAINR